jgi:GMP synthase-like glutamine amidotransferase
VTSRALFLRHHNEDRPGLIGEAFEARDYELHVVMMDEKSPTPSVEGFDVLVILGSKHAVYDQEVEAAWFGRELDVIAEADRFGRSYFRHLFRGSGALCASRWRR